MGFVMFKFVNLFLFLLFAIALSSTTSLAQEDSEQFLSSHYEITCTTLFIGDEFIIEKIKSLGQGEALVSLCGYEVTAEQSVDSEYKSTHGYGDNFPQIIHARGDFYGNEIPTMNYQTMEIPAGNKKLFF